MRYAIPVLFLVVAVARADDAADREQLKKLMSKDQLEVVAKVEELQEIQKRTTGETNPARRKKSEEDSEKIDKELTTLLTAQMKKTGLKEWVGSLSMMGRDVMVIRSPGLFHIAIPYEGMGKAQLAQIRELDDGQLVRFSLNRDLAFKPSSLFFDVLRLSVKGPALKSIERAD